MRQSVSLYWLAIFLPLQIIHHAVAADIIGPDDALRISVYGYDDLKTETRVSADGRITFPLIGEVKASGKSSIELEKTIAERLTDERFIQNANVTVVVLERISQYISVLGYVNKPGRYPLDSNTSIVDLIAMAGGVTTVSTNADVGDNKAIVTRVINAKAQKIQLNLRDFLENPETVEPFLMQAGDFVYVPKAPMFYIYGEVQRPGGYRLEPGLTVVKAISIAGGLTLRATENSITIKRKNANNELEEIDVELVEDILKDDVVYVGERWF